MLDSSHLKRTRRERRLTLSSNVFPGIIVALDSVAILGSGLLTYIFITQGLVEEESYYAAAIIFAWLVTVTLLRFGGLYQWEPLLSPMSFIDKIVVAFATTFLFLMAAAFALKISTGFSRLWAGSFAVSSPLLVVTFRLLGSFVLSNLVSRRFLTRNLIIVGSESQIRRFLERLYIANPKFISVLGVFSNDLKNVHDLTVPVLGSPNDLPAFVRSHDVDDVVISMPWSADDQITELTDMLHELPVNVYLGADLIGFRMQLGPPPDHFSELPLLEIAGRPLAGWGGFQKAVLDYTLGTILAICFLPVMMMIALAIKLESKGPVIFRQERYGFANRRFEIFKFRTMRVQQDQCETVQARRNDPRVTRIGRVLRRFSLDELPQLFNVLNGTMSLIGPRPHAIDHNEMYSQVIRGYFARHRVKPGLTGWAQVNGFRGETQTVDLMEARVKYDEYYVENWSLMLDFKILAKTVFICLTGRNAY